MRALLINNYDIQGGAARAAYRIHHALRASGADSTLAVNVAAAGDWSVQGRSGHVGRALPKLRHVFGALVAKALKTENRILHSPAVLSSTWPKRINDSDAEIVNLHWVNHEMLSIGDIARINKPLVWTLHDMWAFCGAEHYTEDLRWREGYSAHNRPGYESGFDLNRWVWNRKRRLWKSPFNVVTPSNWLADCVRQSVLMREWPVTVIHNPIDTEIWQPVEKKLARRLLSLPTDVPLLLFGAMGGGQDPRKGFDLLRTALSHLRGGQSDLQLVVFGQLAPRLPEDLGFPVHYVGHLHDDLTLRLLYSAADLLVVPSRQDISSNVGIESLSCGTPVVAFNACGLPDIVRHQQTGYLANAFDTEDMASGIQWVINDSTRHKELCKDARADAVARFSYPVIASQYLQLYESVSSSRCM